MSRFLLVTSPSENDSSGCFREVIFRRVRTHDPRRHQLRTRIEAGMDREPVQAGLRRLLVGLRGRAN